MSTYIYKTSISEYDSFDERSKMRSF